MAGDWLPIRFDLVDDPAIISIAEDLNISVYDAEGRVIKIWVWFSNQTIDGHALSVTKTFVDRYVDLPGFAESMAKAGWLEVGDGYISIPNFERYMSNSAKERALARKRQEKHREKMSRCQRDKFVTSPSLREEKRIEEKKEKKLKQRKESCNEPSHSFSGDLEQAMELVRKAYEKSIGGDATNRVRGLGKIRDRIIDGYSPEQLCLAAERYKYEAAGREPKYCTALDNFFETGGFEIYLSDSWSPPTGKKAKYDKENYELGEDGILRRKEV